MPDQPSLPMRPDLLLVATTGDAATPYAGALSVAESLDNAHLLTYEGEGHTIYGNDRCIDELVNDYPGRPRHATLRHNLSRLTRSCNRCGRYRRAP